MKNQNSAFLCFSKTEAWLNFFPQPCSGHTWEGVSVEEALPTLELPPRRKWPEITEKREVMSCSLNSPMLPLGLTNIVRIKGNQALGWHFTIQRFLMLMLEEAGGSKRKCWTCPAVARIRSPAGAPGIPCLYHFYLKTAKSRNLRIKVTLGHLLLFLFREQTVFSVVNILRQTEPLKSRHGKGVRHVTEKSSLWNFLPMSDVDSLVVGDRLNYLENETQGKRKGNIFTIFSDIFFAFFII